MCPPAAPGPMTVAVSVRVTAAGVGGPVEGAFYSSSGALQSPQAGCQAEADASICVVPGGPGTYDLVIGAPDYQSVHRSVTVVCKDEGPCGCSSFDPQTLDVSLSR